MNTAHFVSFRKTSALVKLQIAMLLIAMILLQGCPANDDLSDVEPTSTKANTWIETATNGTPDPSTSASRYFDEVTLIDIRSAISNGEYEKANELLSELVEVGNPEAQYLYAQLLLDGLGVDQDRERALALLKLSSAEGYQESTQLLESLENGDNNVISSSPDSIKSLQERADSGDSNAAYALGLKYRLGEGVQVDYSLAWKYLNQAAQTGHGDAQTQLGYMYYEGEGLGVDYFEARHWFEEAISNGSISAHNGMGILWQFGLGGFSENAQMAYNHYIEAADRGNMYAQYNLGVLWADPPGNYAPDYDQALFWLRIAKLNGYPSAQAKIDEVEGLRNLQDNLTTGILDSALSLLTGQDPERKEIWPGSPPVCPGDDDEPLIPTSTPLLLLHLFHQSLMYE